MSGVPEKTGLIEPSCSFDGCGLLLPPYPELLLEVGVDGVDVHAWFLRSLRTVRYPAEKLHPLDIGRPPF